MLRAFKIPMSWTELFKRTYRESMEDNILGLAAQLAFYFFLALFPALLFLIALASYLPGRVLDAGVEQLAGFMPPDVLNIIREQMQRLAGGEDTHLLTIGILGAIWSSSAALVAVVDAMNRAYDVEETRPWWKVRLTAILLTMGLAVFIILSFSLVLVGPFVAEWLAGYYGLGAAFEWTWKIAQWPVALALVAFAIALVNYFAPDVEQDWRWITPGSIVATVSWLIASLGFRIYVVNFGEYNAAYGSIGGVMVLMLWFYISGLAILFGAEMNSEIEHASADGKDKGEHVAGEKGGATRPEGRPAAARRGSPALQPAPAPAHAAAGMSMASRVETYREAYRAAVEQGYRSGVTARDLSLVVPLLGAFMWFRYRSQR
jgi:membrane protein